MKQIKLFSEYRGLRKELYVLFLGRMMTNFGSMIWPMLTLILKQKLNMDGATIALCFMIYSFVAMPINLLGGKLADKWNKKNIIVVCDAVSIAAYIYCACVPMTYTTIVIFSLASLFQSIEYPAYEALVADFTTSADRERAYSLSYLGTNLGLVLAPTVGGLLLNNYLNLAFAINGIAIAISTVFIAVFIKNIAREPDDNAAASEYEADLEEGVSAFAFLRKNRVISLYVLLSAIGGAVYGMYNYLMPMHLTDVYGDNGSVIYGTMSSTNCLVVIFCTALITRLFVKLRDGRKMIVGEGLILLGYLLFFLFIKSAFLCYVSIIVFTFGEIFNTLANSPFVTRRIPASHRGRLLSIQNVFGSIVSAGIQYGAGRVYDASGASSAWLIVIGFSVMTVALVALLTVFDKKDYPKLQGGTPDEHFA